MIYYHPELLLDHPECQGVILVRSYRQHPTVRREGQRVD